MDQKMAIEKSNLILLGNRFLINPNLNEIRVLVNGAPGSPIKIEPKVMKVLVSLMANQNKLVTKEFLADEIWDGYGGAEEALMQAISKLRRVFNDKVKNSRVIETIPKQGYRMLMSVVPISTEIYESDGDDHVHYVERSALLRAWDRLVQPKYFLVLIVVAFAILGMLGLIYQIVFWSR